MKDKEIEVIIKPIFTKMFNENFSACDYGIECFKKGTEYQGIKELTIENDNLIKRNTELEKENAELKAELKAIDEAGEEARKHITESFRNKKPYWELEKELTKAKKLLKKVVTDFHNMDCVTVHINKTITEAEQFLNSEVEK